MYIAQRLADTKYVWSKLAFFTVVFPLCLRGSRPQSWFYRNILDHGIKYIPGKGVGDMRGLVSRCLRLRKHIQYTLQDIAKLVSWEGTVVLKPAVWTCSSQ